MPAGGSYTPPGRPPSVREKTPAMMPEGATTSWSLDPNTLRDGLSTFTRGQ